MRPKQLSIDEANRMRAMKRTHGWKLSVLADEFKCSVATASKVIRGEHPYEIPQTFPHDHMALRGGAR